MPTMVHEFPSAPLRVADMRRTLTTYLTKHATPCYERGQMDTHGHERLRSSLTFMTSA